MCRVAQFLDHGVSAGWADAPLETGITLYLCHHNVLRHIVHQELHSRLGEWAGSQNEVRIKCKINKTFKIKKRNILNSDIVVYVQVKERNKLTRLWLYHTLYVVNCLQIVCNWLFIEDSECNRNISVTKYNWYDNFMDILTQVSLFFYIHVVELLSYRISGIIIGESVISSSWIWH